MPEHVELVALSLAGRGPRADEAPIADLDRVLDEIVSALPAFFDMPFAFFGHSMGSVLAFEVARRLRATGAPTPIHLFASAHTGPHLAPRGEDMHRLPDDAFVEQLQTLGGLPEAALTDPSLLALILPSARADFRLTAYHRWTKRDPLDMPLTALGGRDDPSVNLDELQAWRDATTGPFRVQRFAGAHFYTQSRADDVIAWVVAALDTTVEALPRSILVGPEGDYPESTLHALFLAQAARTPDRVAIVEGDAEITFGALAARVLALADAVRAAGVGRGDRIALYFEASIDYVVGVLAAMQAGGAYMPVDIAYPEPLVRRVLETARPAVVLTRGDWSTRLPVDWRPRSLRVDGEFVPAPVGTDTASGVGPDDLAYCVMSSGTTGVPKGIICPHRGAVTSYFWRYRNHPYLPDDREGSNLFFVWEVIRPLLVGTPTCIIPGEVIYDPPRLVDFIEQHRITRMMFTPSLIEQVLETPGLDIGRRLAHLRVIYLSGEVTPTALARRIARRLPQLTVLNDYSISECHDVCHLDLGTIDPSTAPRFVPVGPPMDNVRLYVLDAERQPVPIGMRGELYVGGDAVGCGYLDQPEMTAERFVHDPFADGGRPMFRTGDAGRIRHDGQVEVLGRVAFMIKLRGYSIVPGAVEATITEYPGVAAAVVTTRDDPDTGQPTHLVAYVVAESDTEVSLPELRGWLEETLPHYAVPAYLIPLDALPMAATGKLDRRALPAPGPAHLAIVDGGGDAPPRTPTEALLGSIWAEVLGVDRVGPTDNFFHLGGHSLLAARSASILTERLGRTVSVVDLFQYPTARALGAHLDGETEAPASAPSRPASTPARNDVAIVGMACRFPGADGIDAFWDVLRAGLQVVRTLTEDELVAAGLPLDVVRRPDYVPLGAHLDAVDRFDPAFWGMTVREATEIDPQHRLFLECCWHALEDAGLPPSTVGERAGVYGGAFLPQYLLHHLRGGGQMDLGDPLSASMTEFGNDKDYITQRASYLLDLRGPSVTIQTSCSTSLVAALTACQALVAGTCDVALAGGASIAFPQGGYVYTEGLDSPDGRCRAFDACADGTLLGDGVGVVVLKRLDDALADGDPIRAIIKGGAINNDGGQKANFASPSVRGQTEVVRAAHAVAGVSPESIGYVEAHGTGTPVGDVMEVRGLTAAFEGAPPGHCALGSIKPSIGHSSIASGVAGLIKTALCLEHRELPPLAGFETPNPNLRLDETPFYINRAVRPWPVGTTPRRAGLTSLGIGGTNCHVVLEEPPRLAMVPEADRPRALCLSARSGGALARGCRRLAEHLRQHPDVRLADVAHTLHLGRDDLPMRIAVVCRDHASAIAALESAARSVEQRPPEPVEAPIDNVGLLFPGGGVHSPRMGIGLYRTMSVYRRHFEACGAVVARLTGHDLEEILYTGPDAESGAGLDGITVFQMATFAVEYAIARSLIDAGIRPEAVVGHSLGEYVAACIAGVLTLDEAIELLVVRSAVMEAETAPGAMLAATMPEADATALLDRIFPHWRSETHDDATVIGLSLVNGPLSVVFGGAPRRIDAVRDALAEAGVRHRVLATSNRASHSPLMRSSARALDARADGLDRRAPTVPMTLNATGGWLRAPALLPEGYWGQQLTRTVRFEANARQLLDTRPRLLLETGPGQTLSRLVEQIADDAVCCPLMRHPKDDADDAEHLLSALADAWQRGLPVDWRVFESTPDARRIPLPGYAFERVRCWPDALPDRLSAAPVQAQSDDDHPLLGRRQRSSALTGGQRLFERRITPNTPSWIADHGDPPLLPATGFVEMALAAGATLYAGPLALQDMSFERALVFDDGARIVQTLMTPDGASGHTVQISSVADDDADDAWVVHARGRVGPASSAPEWISTTDDFVAAEPDAFYETCARRGYHFGPAFRLIAGIERGATTARGTLKAPGDTGRDVLVHPCLLDACIQLAWAIFDDPIDADPYLPVGIDTLILHRPARGARFGGRVRVVRAEGVLRSVDVQLLDETGAPVVTVLGAEEKRVARWALAGRPRWQDWLRSVRWPARPLPADGSTAPSQSVLILRGADGLGEPLTTALAESGHTVTVARAGERFDRESERRYVVSMQDGDLREVLRAAGPFDSIVHAWSLDAEDNLDAVDPMNASRRSCGSAAELIRSIAEDAAGDPPPKLVFVTRGARAIEGDCPRPDLAPIWAVAQCIRIEHPDIGCLSLDLDPDASVETNVRALVHEIVRADDEGDLPESQVAYRNGHRRVARFVPSGVKPLGGLTFNRDASYLITGGLGGLGLHVARWMADRGAGRLVLLSRSTDKPHLAESIDAVRAAGAEVVCVAADVNDRPGLERLIADTSPTRPLRGVVHTAGALDDGVLMHLTGPRFEAVMRTRIQGTWNLHLATRDLPLDHFVLFSSDAGGLGYSGQANHAAGNAFLDAFAAWRQARGWPAISVAWGGWSTVGGATAKHMIAQVEREGMGLIEPDEGLAILETAMLEGHPYLDVTPIDWARFLAARSTQALSFFEAFRADGSGRPSGAGRADAQSLGDTLPERVIGVMRELLGLPAEQPIGGDVSLFTIGVDSLMALVVKNKLQGLLGLRLPATLLYRHPTLDGLIEHLHTLVANPSDEVAR